MLNKEMEMTSQSGNLVPLISIAVLPWAVCASVLLILFLTSSSRDHTRQKQIGQKCKSIAVGIHNYYDTFENLPSVSSTVNYNGSDFVVSWRHLIHRFVDQPKYDQETGYPECPGTLASMSDLGLYVYGVCGRDTVLTKGDLDNVPADAVMFVCANETGCAWDSPCEAEIISQGFGVCTGIKGEVGIAIQKGSVALGFADGAVWVLESDTPREKIYPFFTIQGASSHSREELLSNHRIKL